VSQVFAEQELHSLAEHPDTPQALHLSLQALHLSLQALQPPHLPPQPQPPPQHPAGLSLLHSGANSNTSQGKSFSSSIVPFDPPIMLI